MDEGKRDGSFALLFFSGKGKARTMYVSDPPPEWLCGENLSSTTITLPGMYCLFFLVLGDESLAACFEVNGRRISESTARARRGKVSGSAVCSIRTEALPCSLSVATSGGCECGLFLVIKYDI